MMKEYQVTLICATGQYRPVSCIVKKDSEEIKKKGKDAFIKELQTAGIQKICMKRGWTKWNLVHDGYTKVKVREYDKEKIEQENKERYEKLKEEKYASGEWKRPKTKE